MKYQKILFIIFIIFIIILNINISTPISINDNNFTLSQIAFANNSEGGSGESGYKKCGQGTKSFTPAHGATACIYCGDCESHWVFITFEGDCKLYNK